MTPIVNSIERVKHFYGGDVEGVMSKFASFWEGLEEHGNRHAREAVKPILAGVVAGKIVQVDPPFVVFAIAMALVLMIVVVTYELFERIYGRPEHSENRDDRENVRGPAS